MDENAQMYVYEAIGVVLMMIAAVYFFNTFITPPVAPEIDLNYQLESYGKDALRINYDFTRASSSKTLGYSIGRVHLIGQPQVLKLWVYNKKENMSKS